MFIKYVNLRKKGCVFNKFQQYFAYLFFLLCFSMFATTERTISFLCVFTLIANTFLANAKESDDIDRFYASLAIKARQLTPKKEED